MEYFDKTGEHAEKVALDDAVETNERTDLETYTLLQRKSVDELTKQINKLVDNAVDTDIYFAEDQDTLDEAYAKSVAALITLRLHGDSLLKRITTTYNTRSVN
jgi:hypothetical protein